MQIWFIYALLSSYFLAFAELLQQKLLNDKNPLSARLSMGFTSLVNGLIAITILLATFKIYEILPLFFPANLPFLILVIFNSFISVFLYLKSFKVKNISISIIFMSVSIIVSNILGILIYNESTSLFKAVGVGLILIGIIIINYAKGSIEKNHKYAIFAGIIFGSNYIIDKNLVSISSPLAYMGILFLGVALTALISNFKNLKNEIAKVSKPVSIFTLIFISGSLYFFYNLCTYLSYNSNGEVGKIDSINNSYIFIIIVVEYIFYKQRDDVFKKVISAILTTAGVLILGYYK